VIDFVVEWTADLILLLVVPIVLLVLASIVVVSTVGVLKKSPGTLPGKLPGIC